MSLRFRRRIRIAPGISLNVSKGGLGISAGPRGAKIGIGPRGMNQSLGIPGTGLHYRKEDRWGSAREMWSQDGPVIFQLYEDGSVEAVDSEGHPLPPRLLRAIKKEQSNEIQEFLEQQCERWNDGIDVILKVHFSTPHPGQNLRFEPNPFQVAQPEPFSPRRLGMFGRIWRPRRRQIEQENEERRKAWDASVAEWHLQKKMHEESEAARKRDFEYGRFTDIAAMERVFEHRLALLDWPRETFISYQIRDAGRSIWMDVDLPEIEDMPREQASVAARGLKLNIKTKSDAQIRKEYMQHIHGVLFRLIGEAFFTLPTALEVVASGYSQRADPATGNLRDDYLISMRVPREDWCSINFHNLEALDVIMSFERFELRRKMTKTGIFKPIEPLVVAEK